MLFFIDAPMIFGLLNGLLWLIVDTSPHFENLTDDFGPMGERR